MKRVLLSLSAATMMLAACGKDNSAALQKEVKSLEQEKSDIEKNYEDLKKQNDEKSAEIKKMEQELDSIQKKKEADLKKQIALEEQKKAEERIKAEQEAKKQQQEALKNKKSNETVKKIMPNTIEASTNGKSKLVKNYNDINLQLDDSGMKVDISQLQIFHVTQMPKGQVLLFDGAENGYVIMYQVTTENTSDEKLYYNNNTQLTVLDEMKYSDFASFIPSDAQEMSMKKNKQNFNEYAPHERTTSYKSIVLTEKGFKALEEGKAKLVIQAGISKDKDFNNQSEKTSQAFTFK